jgi:hypothetical protein
MSAGAFRNTSPPKFTEPMESVAISGFRLTGARRSCGVMPTAPPVLTCTITSQRCFTSAMIWR